MHNKRDEIISKTEYIEYIKDVIDPLIREYNRSHKPEKFGSWKIGYEIWEHKKKDALIITVSSNTGNNSKYYMSLNARQIKGTNNLQVSRKTANDKNMGIFMLSLNHYYSINSAIRQIKVNTKLIANMMNNFIDFLASKSVKATDRFITLHYK